MIPILGRHDPLRPLPTDDLAFSALPDAPVTDDAPRSTVIRIRRLLHGLTRRQPDRPASEQQPSFTPCPTA